MIYNHCPNCSGPLIDVIDVSDLSERHQKALVMFVEKFRAGAKQHGDLVKGKNWTADMLSERVDDNFYAIFQLLEILENEHG